MPGGLQAHRPLESGESGESGDKGINGCARIGLGTASLLDVVYAHTRVTPHARAIADIDSRGDAINGVSYGSLLSASTQLAGMLSKAAPPRSTILLHSQGGEWQGACLIAYLLAAMQSEMYLCPTHPHATPAEVYALAQRAGAAIVVSGANQRLQRDGCSRLDMAAAQQLLEKPSPVSPGGATGLVAPRCKGGIILQSSGTTGASKLVVRSAASLLADARQVIAAIALSPQDRLVAATPLCHSYGVDMLAATLASGAALHILTKFDAIALAAQLRREATVFPGVPFMFEALARVGAGGGNVCDKEPHHASRRLRLAFSAGAPLPTRIEEAMRQSWGVRIGQLFGMTELGSVTFNHPDSADFAPSSVGTPMEGVQVRILDMNDSTGLLPPGESRIGIEGQIAIRADSMLSGYLCGGAPPHCEPPALIDRYFPTGDLGRIDSAGRLYITGRIKFLIDVGGQKVNPLDVESVLCTHPDVAECAVVPLVISDTVTRLRALVVPVSSDRPPREEVLRGFVKERIAPYKVPRVFETVDSLPRSPTGKLLRAQLEGMRA